MQYPAILLPHTSNNRFIIHYSDLAAPRDRQLMRMHSTKVVAACMFNKLQAAGLFLALDSTNTRTHNESLFVVSAGATSTFQLKHMPWLPRICPVGYRIKIVEYGKILVMCSMEITVGMYTRYICTYIFKMARSPVFSRSTNLECKLIEFFVFVKYSPFQESQTVHCP